MATLFSSKMSATSSESDVILDVILDKNLELVDRTYIILHVVDQERAERKRMCLGEVVLFQNPVDAQDAVPLSSASSELPSDQTE
ncbi:LEF-10 [Olene mendosa nucleopolyhedrovirus]|uniref:LEF-10 n=1 Tax=Olene mendosa nucleopolyhedrovirus TaxID=2933796 RepID=A0AAX3AUA5_9ABAC|nr:LEF-10 [Olene mendosa nucleopolyhedrovirus]UOQ18832.1 LEF-10 [Olene mendosa nucleopolyhedrovirus]